MKKKVKMLKNYTKELEKSELKFRMAFENSLNAILWVDMETGIIIDCNNAAQNMFERTKNELTGIHFSVLHPEGIAGQIKDDFDKANSNLNKGLPVSLESEEIIIKTKSGKIKDTLISVSIVEIDGKQISQGVFIDITPQKKLLEELKESEKKFRLAFESSHSAIVWVDVEKEMIIDCNPAAESLFERSKNDLIGQNITILHPPELSDNIKKTFRKTVRRHKKGIYKNLHGTELPIITKTGKIKSVLFSSSLSKLAGRMIIQGMIIDITDRKKLEAHLAENEKKYRNLFEYIQDAIALFEVVRDENGVIIDRIIRDANPAFVKLASAPDLDFLKNKTMTEAFGKKMADESLPQVRMAMSTGAAQNIEVRVEGNGKFYDFSNILIPISDNFFLSRTTDISSMRESDRKKDEFISVASHELKTPLTSLKLYSQILMTKKEGYDGYALKMNEQIEKLTGLVNELLDVSKIQSSKLQLNKELFSLAKLVKSCIDSVQIITAYHMITFKNTVSCEVLADKARIDQVLINLLTNAIKYSPDRGKIVVSLKKNKDTAEISVRDYGIGIDKNHIERVFDKFYRTKNNASQVPGLGMGLFISKKIIHQHGGKIWVISKAGKGSTFYFTLPIDTHGSK